MDVEKIENMVKHIEQSDTPLHKVHQGQYGVDVLQTLSLLIKLWFT